MLSPRGWAIIWVKALIRAWARIQGNNNLLILSLTSFFIFLYTVIVQYYIINFI